MPLAGCQAPPLGGGNIDANGGREKGGEGLLPARRGNALCRPVCAEQKASRGALMGRRGSFICLPFSREKGGARLFFAGAAPPPPRRRASIPPFVGGPPSCSIDGLAPANARKTGRLQRGREPGKGKNLPSQGQRNCPCREGGAPVLSSCQGVFVCCPTGHFWGRRPTAVRRRGRWILIGRREGFIRLPFSREKGQHAAALNEWGRAAPSPLEGPRPPLCRGAPIAAP